MADVRSLWVETSQSALDLAAVPQVEARWGDPSSLPDMTIGALVGHVLHSGILFLEECLDQPVPTARPIRTAALFSMIPLDVDDDVNTAVRDVAVAYSGDGPDDLLERTGACRARLVVRLSKEPADRVLTSAVSGYPVPWQLDEFLAARILELVVHLDDLATSLDDMELDLSKAAIALTCHVGIDICMRRHGPLPVMQALYRRDRNPLDALRPM